MKLATNTLESLLAATSAALHGARRPEKIQKLERILRRHDRKGELRARILAMTPQHFKQMSRRFSFEQLVHQAGFSDVDGFCHALMGKLREELHLRGWSRARIERLVVMNATRPNYAF